LKPKTFSFVRQAAIQGEQALRAVRWGELLFLAGAPGLGLIAGSPAEEGLGMLALRGGALLVVALLVGAHVFLINDICDRVRDRCSPERRSSPLASGELPVRAAWGWALVLGALGLLGSWALLGGASLVVAGLIVLVWDSYAWGPLGWGKCHPVAGATHNMAGGGLHFLLGVVAAGKGPQWSEGVLLWTCYFGLLCLGGYLHHVARQAEADRASGVRTPATLWGERTASLLAAGVLVGSTVYLTVGLAVCGELGRLALPLGWLWLSLPLYLFGLRGVLGKEVGWAEGRRFQRYYRGLYLVFGLLLAPFFWGALD